MWDNPEMWDGPEIWDVKLYRIISSKVQCSSQFIQSDQMVLRCEIVQDHPLWDAIFLSKFIHKCFLRCDNPLRGAIFLSIEFIHTEISIARFHQKKNLLNPKTPADLSSCQCWLEVPCQKIRFWLLLFFFQCQWCVRSVK